MTAWKKEVIRLQGGLQTRVPSSAHAVRFGPIVFVTGQSGRRPMSDGPEYSDDPVEQARQCLDNIGRILEGAGTSFENVLKRTIFIRDRREYDATLDAIVELVGVVEREGRETQIAVARYIKSDAGSAHIAIVVADEWQGRGIGARLLELLEAAARARGIVRFEGEVLAENAPIRALLARLGYSFRRDPEAADVVLVEKALTGAVGGP